MALVRFFNPRSNLFATGFSFLAQAVIRLASSLVLTRILRPEAYGVVTVLLSVMFVVEMLADLGITVFIVREPNVEEPRYLNTAWTMRLVRAVSNGLVVFLFAPAIASLYHVPDLVTPLRVFALWFLFGGLESMSFPLAVRHGQARLQMYSELISTLFASLFSVIYCYYSRDYWGMVYGILLNRALTTLMSFHFYPQFRPKLQFDRLAARAIFRYTRLTVPSGILTLLLTQFDKVAFLRLFDLRLLGVYALGVNLATPIESVIGTVCHMVLYPRCAHDARTDPANLSRNYYTRNTRLFASILVLPAGVGGAASLLIATLYDPRYASAAGVLRAFMLRATLSALATPAEVLLIAAGESQVILVGSVFRTLWTVAASLAGYYFFGFAGFVYGTASSVLPALAYYMRLQHKRGLLMVKYELYKVSLALAAALSAYALSELLSALPSMIRMHLA